MFRRWSAWFALAALPLTACSTATEQAPQAASTDDGDAPGRPTPAEAPPDDRAPFVAPTREPCRQDRIGDATTVMLTGEDPVDVAARTAQRTHRCAPIAVVAPIDAWAATLAVPVALAADAPLLVVDPDDPATVGAVLERLDVEELITVGIELTEFGYAGTSLTVPAPGSGSEPLTADAGDPSAPPAGDEQPLEPVDDELVGAERDIDLALIVANHLGVDRFVAIREDDIRGRTAAAIRTDGSQAILPVPVDNGRVTALAEALPTTAQVDVVSGPGGQGLADALLSVGVDAALSDGDRWPTGPATGWLVDPDQPTVGSVAAVAARARDEALFPIDGSDLRAVAGNVDRIRDAELDRTVLIGEVTDAADWQLELVLHGARLPGGGLRLFEEERIVALYGSPLFPALGALGEQDLDASVERLREVAAPYDTDGVRVLPAFEIITTIASTSAEATGDYSRRTAIDDLRPYVDRAAAEGFYVILDLQPGRTDFLEQAQEYEELLLEPHVGLALDPEWRIGPDEVHLQRIGSVEVAEVQRVVDWLAALTQDHLLPQKLLLLHQFTDDMLPDRDELMSPPQLATVIHMDGQGTLGSKRETYANLTRDAEERWVWGWKNFYDEDAPLATPQQVLELAPLPLVVTYQ